MSGWRFGRSSCSFTTSGSRRRAGRSRTIGSSGGTSSTWRRGKAPARHSPALPRRGWRTVLSSWTKRDGSCIRTPCRLRRTTVRRQKRLRGSQRQRRHPVNISTICWHKPKRLSSRKTSRCMRSICTPASPRTATMTARLLGPSWVRRVFWPGPAASRRRSVCYARGFRRNAFVTLWMRPDVLLPLRPTSLHFRQ
jgi:hypothetical protein